VEIVAKMATKPLKEEAGSLEDDTES